MSTPVTQAHETMGLRQQVEQARAAQQSLAAADGAARTKALLALAAILEERRATLLEANVEDVANARGAALAPALLDRLRLSEKKVSALCEGARQLAGRADPVGATRLATELDAGLVLNQVTSPIGLLLVIFESRPDAVIQIGALALRSGNAVVLKGGREAAQSNAALVGCLREALARAGLDPAAVLLVPGREEVAQLLAWDDLIDLVIPRGSGALVRQIKSSTRIPVLGHAEGVCHLYLDGAADPAMAVRLAVDGKCDYPAACNATETLLCHRDFLPHLAEVGKALMAAGVEVRADARSLAVLPGGRQAAADDFGKEFGDLTIAVRVVDDIGEAIAHIRRFGSAHTDAIVTADAAAAERFLREVDSASVFHNASTRFADGYRYGLGAEVGISTGRIHARGPVGVEGLLTTRWLLRGSGQVVSEYSAGKRHFSHRPLPV